MHILINSLEWPRDSQVYRKREVLKFLGNSSWEVEGVAEAPSWLEALQ